jgi:hypothetical protein
VTTNLDNSSRPDPQETQMNTDHNAVLRRITTAAAAGVLLIAAPTVADAHAPAHWHPCPAADAVTICDLAYPANPTDTDPAAARARPAQADITNNTDLRYNDCDWSPWGPITPCPW